MKRLTKNRVLLVLICIVFGAALLGLGAAIALKIDKNNEKNPYPLLDAGVSNQNIKQGIINFDPLRKDVKQYLAGLNIPHSFYFEYLPNGVDIRDGENQTTVAASLLKTALVMDLYKLAEAKKLNLEDKITVQANDISNDNEYGDPSGIMAGQTLTYKQAAYLALHNSDNTAINLVKRAIEPVISDGNEVILNLDISYDVDSKDSSQRILQISARSYSSILKCLYYSCFLNPVDSQQILTNLIGSEGTDKLLAGLPSNIQVAHKIGSAGNKQSDCGIIYQPQKPYLVCLMFFPADNSSDGNTAPYFQKVSKMISDYITSKN